MQFQCFLRIVQGFIQFLVFRIDVMNSSLTFRALSSFGFSYALCCFFFFAEISLTYLTKFVADVLGPGRHRNLRQPHPGPRVSLRWSTIQQNELSESGPLP